MNVLRLKREDYNTKKKPKGETKLGQRKNTIGEIPQYKRSKRVLCLVQHLPEVSHTEKFSAQIEA